MSELYRPGVNYEAERRRYNDLLNEQQPLLKSQLAAIESQQRDLEKARRTMFHRLRSSFSNKYDQEYNRAAIRLQSERARLADELRLNNVISRRLRGGYVGGGEPENEVLSQGDIERRYFPTR